MKKILIGLFAIGCVAFGCEYKECRNVLIADYLTCDQLADEVLEKATPETSTFYGTQFYILSEVVGLHKRHIVDCHAEDYIRDGGLKEIEIDLKAKMKQVEELANEIDGSVR